MITFDSRMIIKDYYKVLGIDRTASSKEIKAAYYKLAKKFHPDRNPGRIVENKFKDITEAYKVLGNLENRLEYAKLLNLDVKLVERINQTEDSLQSAVKKNRWF